MSDYYGPYNPESRKQKIRRDLADLKRRVTDLERAVATMKGDNAARDREVNIDRHLLYDAVMPVIRDQLGNGKVGNLGITNNHRDHEAVLGSSDNFLRTGRAPYQWARYIASDGQVWQDGKVAVPKRPKPLPKPVARGKTDAEKLITTAYYALLAALTDPDKGVNNAQAASLINRYHLALLQNWEENKR